MLKLFTSLLLIITLFGCLGSKKVSEKTVEKTTIEKSEVKKDSTSITKINQPISDKIKIPVPVANTTDVALNKAVDQKVDEILSKLNSAKSSGDNSYKLYYDLLNRQIQFETTIGETTNQTTTTNALDKSEKSTDEVIDNYVFKIINQVPWYIWLVLAFIVVNELLDFGQKLSKPLIFIASLISKLKK